MVVVVVAFVRAEQKFHMGMLVRIADNVEKRANKFLILLFSSSIFFLIIHTVQHHSTPPPPLANAQQPPLASLLQATLCGRLGEALKSDAYVDFRAGQLTRVNLVEVSG